MTEVTMAVYFARPADIPGLGTFIWNDNGLSRITSDGLTVLAHPDEYESAMEFLASLESVDQDLLILDSWRQRRQQYAQMCLEKAREEVAVQMDRIKSMNMRDPGRVWGPGKEYKNRRHALATYKNIMESLSPELWYLDHEMAVIDAMQKGLFSEGDPVLDDYPHLRNDKVLVEPFKSARHLIKLEERPWENGSQVRAVVTFDDGLCHHAAWIDVPDLASYDSDEVMDNALADWATKYRYLRPYTELLDGQSASGQALSEKMHPYVIPANRPGIVAFSENREWAVRPVLRSGISNLVYTSFARDCSGGVGSWVPAGAGYTTTYDQAIHELAQVGLPEDATIADPILVEAVLSCSQDPPPLFQERDFELPRAGSNFYEQLCWRGRHMEPTQDGRIRANTAEGNVSIDAVCFGELAMHKPLAEGGLGFHVSHAGTGRLVASLHTKDDALALIYLLNNSGVDWKRLKRDDIARARDLVACFSQKELPPVTVTGVEMVQLSIF